MRIRQAHCVHRSTVLALSERQNGFSLRVLARALGLPANACAMLSDVLRGKPGALSRMGERDLRQRLGMSASPRRRYLRPCLSLDPAERIGQLERLLEAARAELP